MNRIDDALELAKILIEKEKVEKEIERLDYNEKKRNERKTKSK